MALFYGLQTESPENGNFRCSCERLSGLWTTKVRKRHLRDSAPDTKTRNSWAFPRLKKLFSKSRTAWLGREDSNCNIPVSEKPFETTREISAFRAHSSPETFTPWSCENAKDTTPCRSFAKTQRSRPRPPRKTLSPWPDWLTTSGPGSADRTPVSAEHFYEFGNTSTPASKTKRRDLCLPWVRSSTQCRHLQLSAFGQLRKLRSPQETNVMARRANCAPVACVVRTSSPIFSLRTDLKKKAPAGWHISTWEVAARTSCCARRRRQHEGPENREREDPRVARITASRPSTGRFSPLWQDVP